MMTRIRFATTLLVLFYSTLVHASDMQNGNGYYVECHKEPTSLECWAYFEGLAHGASQAIEITAMRIYPDKNYEQFNARRQSLSMFCLPENATVGQMFDVFLKYLKDNPSKRNQTTGLLYFLAMHDAFPCATTK